MNLVERAKNLILTPAAEWDKIASEEHTVRSLYTGWIMILAAVPAIASYIGLSVVGTGAFGLTYRVPAASAMAHAIVSYVLSLILVYVLALAIDAITPRFGGEKNFLQAFKVAAFSLVAAWLAGVFRIVPALSSLSILGLYSLYLLYVGLPRLMKTPAEKALSFTVVVTIAAVVISFIVGTLAALLLPGRLGGY